MKTTIKRLMAFAGVLALGLVAVKAQTDSALIDALVKKGVLSNKEATDIRADEQKDYNQTAASKLAVSNYVQKLQFYGDGRLRFDAYGQKYNYQNGVGVNDRERYRLRFGVNYTYSPELSAGFELRSGTASDTANQSFGGSFADAGINVSKIFIQYKPVDWATLVAGKFTQPLYTTTDMMWANDLTPEGGAETLSYTFPLGDGGSAPIKDAKDMKAVAPASSDSSLTVGLISAQYIYVNQNEATTTPVFGTSNTSDVLIFANQIPITWKVNKDLTVKVVPGFQFYSGGGNTNYGGDVPYGQNNAGAPPAPSFAYGTANSSNDPVFYSPNAFDDLNILSAPGEIDYTLLNQKLRTYWDFDWNITASQRVQNVYLGPGGTFAPGGGAAGYGFVGSTPGALQGFTAKSQAAARSQNQALSDGVAWAVGEQIGENKKKGDWSLLGEFRQMGLGSVDPNTNGTDWGNSYLNQQGVKLQGVYNFTDYLTLTVTYYNTWNYKNNLYSSIGGQNGLGYTVPGAPPTAVANKPLAGTTQYLVDQQSMQRVQVDIGWKF